jgi:cytochrome c peroxidase
MSDAKVSLGRRLFFDNRLSITGRSSCATCHDPARAFSDGRNVPVGATGAALPRNAIALVNVAYNISFGWTKPGVRSLEAQMLQPLLSEHPVELGLKGHESSVCAELAAEPDYAAAFAGAFGSQGPPVTFDHIVKAIAAFERTLISGRSAFDRYVFDGDMSALTPASRRGMALFFSGRTGCSRCHSGINFAGNWRDAQGETGRPSFASNGTSERPVRVPTLRNVALSAPYMHDGRFGTLDAVVDYYSNLAERGMKVDPRLPRVAFTAQERADLVEFLRSLTDETFVRRFANAD